MKKKLNQKVVETKPVHPVRIGLSLQKLEDIMEDLFVSCFGYSYRDKRTLANNIARLSILLLDKKRTNLDEIQKELTPLLERYQRDYSHTND